MINIQLSNHRDVFESLYREFKSNPLANSLPLWYMFNSVHDTLMMIESNLPTYILSREDILDALLQIIIGSNKEKPTYRLTVTSTESFSADFDGDEYDCYKKLQTEIELEENMCIEKQNDSIRYDNAVLKKSNKFDVCSSKTESTSSFDAAKVV